MGRLKKTEKRILSEEGWLLYCSMCDGYKHEDEFHSDKNRVFGKFYICKEHRKQKYPNKKKVDDEMDYFKLFFPTKEDHIEKDKLLISLGYDLSKNIHIQFMKRMQLKLLKKGLI